MAILASGIDRVVMVLVLSAKPMMTGGLQLVHDHIRHALLLVEQQGRHCVGMIDSGVAQLLKHSQQQWPNRTRTATPFDRFC